MIDDDVVCEIRRLLGERRISQRDIARRIGVSRGTVNAIARGRRVGRPRTERPGAGFIAPSGRPVRCPGRGALVQMPCLACQLRSLRGDGL